MSKWIKIRDGNYKYVSDDDSRPAVKLPRKKSIGSFYIPYIPPWRQYEEGIWGEDNKTSKQMSDAFIDEREKEMRTDVKARRWEVSRKERWAKDKPYWVKKYGNG